MRRKTLLLVLLMLVLSTHTVVAGGTLTLATTTSTRDSGLLDHLLPVFEQQTGLEVKVLAVGTGQAIKYGELGDCDVILVHNRASEDQFVDEGYGIGREDVMYNDFVIVGPAHDPAGVRGMGILEALQTLADSNGTFVSRGDDSGTHKKEFELWNELDHTPAGKWYLSVGKGMGDTLIMTNELQAYTLSDRGTYASMKQGLEMEVLVEGDPLLLNPYGVIAVNPELHQGINFDGAEAFIAFLISDQVREIISNYVVNGEQLFSVYQED